MEIKGVTHTIAEYLKKQIITGELTAGQRLNESDLAKSLEVSRPPLREAFRILEKEKLITSIPRKGTKVSEISIEDLEEVFNARRMIEYYAIDLLEMQNVRDLSRVNECLEYESRLSKPSQDNREEYYNYLLAFAEFHIRLIESTGNSWLIQFCDSIASHLARYQFLYLYIPGSGHRSKVEHKEILDCIKSGAYGKSKELLRDHIDYMYEFLREKILQAAESKDRSNQHEKK